MRPWCRPPSGDGPRAGGSCTSRCSSVASKNCSGPSGSRGRHRPGEAREAIGRRDIGMGDQGARLHISRARPRFSSTKSPWGLRPRRGDELPPARVALALPSSVARSALRLRADECPGIDHPARSMELYGQLLRDPQPPGLEPDADGCLAVLMDAASRSVRALVPRGHGAEGNRDRPWKIADGAAASLLEFAPLGRPRGVACAGSSRRRKAALSARRWRSGRILSGAAEYGPLSQQAQQLRRDLKALPLWLRTTKPSTSRARGWRSWSNSASSRKRSCTKWCCGASRRDRFSAAAHDGEIQAGLPAGTALLDFFVAATSITASC